MIVQMFWDTQFYFSNRDRQDYGSSEKVRWVNDVLVEVEQGGAQSRQEGNVKRRTGLYKSGIG